MTLNLKHDILLFGGCNWFGRELINKLLEKKNIVKINIIDNLSSETSSRQFYLDYQYIDSINYIHADVKYINFDNLISDNTYIIYNIWNSNDSIIGFHRLCEFCRKYKLNNKIYFTCDKKLSSIFEKLAVDLKYIGIICDAEIIGNFGIDNVRDKKDTFIYYNRIGNTINFDLKFDYYCMKEHISFLYFLFNVNFDKGYMITMPTNKMDLSKY